MYVDPSAIMWMASVPNCSCLTRMDYTSAVWLVANGRYDMMVAVVMWRRPLNWLAVARWRYVNSIEMCQDRGRDHDGTLVHHNLVLAIGHRFGCRHCRSTHRLRQNSLGYQSIGADEAAVAMIVSNKCWLAFYGERFQFNDANNKLIAFRVTLIVSFQLNIRQLLNKFCESTHFIMTLVLDTFVPSLSPSVASFSCLFEFAISPSGCSFCGCCCCYVLWFRSGEYLQIYSWQ